VGGWWLDGLREGWLVQVACGYEGVVSAFLRPLQRLWLIVTLLSAELPGDGD
jgi:hypothetical protein